MSKDSNRPIEETPEHVGEFVPDITPEEVGNESGGTWHQRHGSDQK